MPTASGRPAFWPRVAPWLAGTLLLLALLGAVFGEGLLGAAGIDGAALLPYEDALFQPQSPCTSPVVNHDTTPEAYNQPWDTLAWRELRSGHWPLWDAENGFGMPLLGSGQASPFNPLKLLLIGGATGVPEAWFLVLRLAIAGVGALWLARALGLDAIASTLVAVAFVGNGTFAYHFHYSDVQALVMLPWLMLAAERLLATPGPRTASVLALAIGLTGMMGHPEAALYAAGGAVASAACGAIVRRAGWRFWLYLTGAGLMAVGLSGITLLPFAELVRHARGYMFDPGQASPARWFGFRAKFVLLGLHLLSPTARPDAFTLNPFVGLVPLALAPLGWGARAFRPASALIAFAVGILMLGPPGRYWPLIDPPPNASYISPLLSLGLALLAGAGLQRLTDCRRGRPIASAIGILGTLALASAWLEHGAAARHLGDFRASLLSAAIAILALLGVRAPRPRGWLLVGVAALAAGWCLRTANPPQRPFAYATTPIVRYLAAQPGLFRVTGGLTALLPNSNVMYGIDSLDASDAFHSARYEAFMNALVGRRLPPTNLYALYASTSIRFKPALLDLANVRYVLDAPDHNGVDLLKYWLKDYPVVMRQGPVTLYANPDAMPRAFVAYSADYLQESVSQAARRLAATPDRWRTCALVETPKGHAPGGWQDAKMPVSPVTIASHGEQSLRLETTLARPGWLVVTNSYDPGWKASVDGEPARIYPADVAFQGIPLSAGKHEIRLRYAPASFRAGFALTLVSLLLALALLVRVAPIRVPAVAAAP